MKEFFRTTLVLDDAFWSSLAFQFQTIQTINKTNTINCQNTPKIIKLRKLSLRLEPGNCIIIPFGTSDKLINICHWMDRPSNCDPHYKNQHLQNYDKPDSRTKFQAPAVEERPLWYGWRITYWCPETFNRSCSKFEQIIYERSLLTPL